MRAIATALIACAVLTSAPAAQTKPAKTFDIYLSDTEGGKATLFVSPSGESVLVGTCEVGKSPAGASPQGILDLAGNVFEWTTSRYDKNGPNRVGRGGSWQDVSGEGLKASRPGPGFLVTYRCGFLGIRCVVEPAKP